MDLNFDSFADIRVLKEKWLLIFLIFSTTIKTELVRSYSNALKEFGAVCLFNKTLSEVRRG
jgi:hypothetical protein